MKPPRRRHTHTHDQQTDIDLMRRVRSGDQQALAALYDRYGGPVYSVALFVLRNRPQAEEVTQSVFLRVWQRAEHWDPARGQLISWLLALARYTAIDTLRREQRRPAPLETPLDDMARLAAQPNPIDDPLWHDGQALRQLLSRLPPEQSQAIHLAFFNGMTHSEIAAALGLPLGTVKTRLRLGLNKLREWWQEASEQ
ncbi:MAG: sigma-70 family RNA polymerase sigma factor [Aggregatilineales bacterium]